MLILTVDANSVSEGHSKLKMTRLILVGVSSSGICARGNCDCESLQNGILGGKND